MKLLIVESPGKVKKIAGFLGNGWKVAASVGHVRDLPVKEMGVAPPDFTLSYVPTERGADVLKRLKAEVANAEEVYLATDPDREGEAISWHLHDALKLKNAYRITFGEITEKAVKTAIGQKRDIDMNLVRAQEARRALDRLCGYMVSGPLSNFIAARTSAGRVQSPAVRLVVEREAAIRNFKVTTHYGVELTFELVENIQDGWKAVWVPRNFLESDQKYILDKALAEKVASIRTLDITDVKETESRSAPGAPFTTSTLQQAASNSLKLSPKVTMSLAQKLYEGGFITYMRTDSPNLSEEFIKDAREYCRANDLPLVDKPRHWKSKAGAQEAHEAIRPTHIEVKEAGESDQEKALYRLIRLRTLAAMLADAVFSVRTVQLQAEQDGKKVYFEAKGKTLTSPGWKVLMEDDPTDDPDKPKEPDNPVPALKVGTKATAMSGEVKTKKTSPPGRFTEAKLVQELEKKGIGRPSTYAAILDNIINSRGYLRLEKRFLVPTPLGEKVVDCLQGTFSFMDYEFTERLEAQFDEIAQGQANYGSVVQEAYNALVVELGTFKKASRKLCPECQGSQGLAHRFKQATKNDRGYDFFSCPDCQATFNNVDGEPVKREKTQQEKTNFFCSCGKALLHIVGKKDDKAYDFFACPEKDCGLKYQNVDGKPQMPEQTGFYCQKCKKALRNLKGISKKTGKPYDFFVCSDKSCGSAYEKNADGSPAFTE